MRLVNAHQARLADGRARLDRSAVSRERSLNPSTIIPAADRPAGDDDALVPSRDERGDLGGQASELAHVERVPARRGEQTCAELDDDTRVRKMHRASQTSAMNRGRPISGCKGAGDASKMTLRFGKQNAALVAQLDRALASEAKGCGFDPRRVHSHGSGRTHPETAGSHVLLPCNPKMRRTYSNRRA